MTVAVFSMLVLLVAWSPGPPAQPGRCRISRANAALLLLAGLLVDGSLAL
jgi:hypothetical protein